MKRWILPAVAVALAAVIAWPFVFGGGTADVKGRSFSVEHRLSDDGDKSRLTPTKNRAALGKGEAVLCSWDKDRFLYFWSDGAKAAFDVAFLDAGGKVLQTGRIRPFSGREGYINDEGVGSDVEARRALFLPEGTVDATSLAPGDSIALSSDLVNAKPEAMTSVNLGGRAIRVEVRETALQRNRGLMHRPKMTKDEGMLFLYPKPRTSPPLNFYMKNTLLSLDIAFFDGSGKLVNVVSAQRAANPAQGDKVNATAGGAAQFVLEMSIGWFKDNGYTDDKGKPLKDVSIELTDALKKRAEKAEAQ